MLILVEGNVLLVSERQQPVPQDLLPPIRRCDIPQLVQCLGKRLTLVTAGFVLALLQVSPRFPQLCQLRFLVLVSHCLDARHLQNSPTSSMVSSKALLLLFALRVASKKRLKTWRAVGSFVPVIADNGCQT